MNPVGVTTGIPAEPLEPQPIQVMVPDTAIEAVGDGRYAPVGHTHEYSEILDKPSDLAALGVEEEVDSKIESNKTAPLNYVILDGIAFADRKVDPVFGTLQSFEDSDVNTFGEVITGGGSSPVLGFFNGTDWTVAAI